MTAENQQSDRSDKAGEDEAIEFDRVMRESLERAQTIAVVGIKDDEREDAYRIPKYMQAHGYQIIPVNPKLETVMGAQAYASLHEVTQARIPVDLVNVFRASENLAPHVDEILAMDPLPKTVWTQLGIHHGPSAKRLREAGIEVVQDRCIMVDHRRLCAD